MATITLEERLSFVEAELAEIKRRLDMNAVHPPLVSLEQNSKTWSDLSADLTEQHDHYIADATLSTGKIDGALDAALEVIWRDTPDAVWEQLPEDLCENLDYYLYGTPKR